MQLGKQPDLRPEHIDFFHLYAQKKFEFRQDWKLLSYVRESILFHRSLAMKAIKTYDQANEDKFEELLASVVQIPASDKKSTKKQMLMR